MFLWDSASPPQTSSCSWTEMAHVTNPQSWDISPLEFVDYATMHQHGVYLCLSAVVFMSYDLLLTFPEEIQFVWTVQPQLSRSKVLFVLTRYLPLVTFFFRFLLLHSDQVDLLNGYLRSNY